MPNTRTGGRQYPMHDVESIYCRILEIARQRVTRAWFKCDRFNEAVEAQHAQLIPALIRCDDIRRHRHYLEVDRVRFVRSAGGAAHVTEFALLWEELGAIVDQMPDRDVPIARAVGTMALDYRNPATRRGS